MLQLSLLAGPDRLLGGNGIEPAADTGLHNGTLYYYNVAANNSVGVSPDTNEVTVTPATGTAFSYTTTTDGTGNWKIDTAHATTSSGTMPAGGLPDGNVGLSVVATDAGCLMNIAGRLRRMGSRVRALHLAQVLANG